MFKNHILYKIIFLISGILLFAEACASERLVWYLDNPQSRAFVEIPQPRPNCQISIVLEELVPSNDLSLFLSNCNAEAAQDLVRVQIPISCDYYSNASPLRIRFANPAQTPIRAIGSFFYTCQ